MSNNNLLNNLLQDERRNMFNNNINHNNNSNHNNNHNNNSNHNNNINHNNNLNQHIINKPNNVNHSPYQLLQNNDYEQMTRQRNNISQRNNINQHIYNETSRQPMMSLGNPMSTNQNRDGFMDNNGQYITSLSQEATKVIRKHPDTITENLGILYNDDSIAQLSVFNKQNEEDYMNHGLEIEKKYIVINSIDRDWTTENNNENVFNFQISFGDASYRLNNNVKYLNHMNVTNDLENVLSLKCTNLVLPNRVDIDDVKISTFPFINLSVDSITNLTNGTNQNLNRCLANLASITPIISGTNYKFIDLRNINQQKKDFKTPLAKLKKLDISITRPDGQRLQNRNDILDIKKIYHISGNSSDYLLRIVTNTYFSNSEYEVGDIIKIRNYVFRDTSTVAISSSFNNFINREEGHVIKEIGKEHGSIKALYDKISIQLPGSYSTTTGDFVEDTFFSTLESSTTIEIGTEAENYASLSSDEEPGKIINTNLQSQIFLEVDVYKKNPKNLIKGLY